MTFNQSNPLEELEEKIYKASGVRVQFVEGLLGDLTIEGMSGLDSEQAKKILEVLKDDGHKRFGIADHSSGLMDELFAFTEAGASLYKAVKFKQIRVFSAKKSKAKTIKAITLKIK